MGAPGIRDLVRVANGGGDSLAAGGYRGTVLRAPADAGARLLVTIDAFDKRRPFEASWVPRSEDSLPAAGDPCLVLLDDGGDAWALATDAVIPEAASPAALVALGVVVSALDDTVAALDARADALEAADSAIDARIDALEVDDPHTHAATTDRTLTTSDQTITGCSWTAPAAGLVMVSAVFDMGVDVAGVGVLIGLLYVDAIAQTGEALFGPSSTGRLTPGQSWIMAVDAGDVLTLQARKTINAGTAVVRNPHTRMHVVHYP